MKLFIFVLSFLFIYSTLAYVPTDKDHDDSMEYICEKIRKMNANLVEQTLKCGEDVKCLNNVKSNDSKFIDSVYKRCEQYWKLKECKKSIYAKCSNKPSLHCGEEECMNSKGEGNCKPTNLKYWSPNHYSVCSGGGYYDPNNQSYNRGIAPNGGAGF